MRLTIPKTLILATITMGFVISGNSAAEAYPHTSALSDDDRTSDSIQYLAQFPGSRNRPNRDADDLEDRLDDMRDRRDDRDWDDFRDDFEDRRDDRDWDDFRDDFEDRRDDRDFDPGNRESRRW